MIIVAELRRISLAIMFDAGFVVGLSEGLSLEETGRLANACGALGATAKGPMEGCAFRRDAFDLAAITERESER